MKERMTKLLGSEAEFEKWFQTNKQPSINSIRCNTLKISPDKLKQKLEERGIQMDTGGVSAKNTSQICSVCGKINKDFTFEYRSKNSFPLFQCTNEECIFNKPISKVSNYQKDYQKYLRDADLNAARNIALRGEKFI